MKDERRAKFIAFFGYLFPVSDTMAIKCWRAARSTLPDEELDGLIVMLREGAIGKSKTLKDRDAALVGDAREGGAT